MTAQFICPGCKVAVSMEQFDHRKRRCIACAIKERKADRIAEDMVLGRPTIASSERVSSALNCLDRAQSAYRVLTTGGSAAALGLALKNKTKALIYHDRILRCEVYQ